MQCFVSRCIFYTSRRSLAVQSTVRGRFSAFSYCRWWHMKKDTGWYKHFISQCSNSSTKEKKVVCTESLFSRAGLLNSLNVRNAGTVCLPMATIICFLFLFNKSVTGGNSSNTFTLGEIPTYASMCIHLYTHLWLHPYVYAFKINKNTILNEVVFRFIRTQPSL